MPRIADPFEVDQSAFEVRRRHRPADRGGWILRVTTISLCIAGALMVGSYAVKWTRDIVGHGQRATDPTPIAVSINGTRLQIPANMIRFDNQRTDAEQPRIDLGVHWPTLRGYEPGNAAAFVDPTDQAPLLFLTIQRRQAATDSAGRLSSVYQHFFAGDAIAAPDGLVGHLLSEDSGLAGEEVYFEAGSTRPFTVHCLAEDGSGFPMSCLSEIHAGGELSVQLRFRKGLLPHWQSISRSTRALLVSFGVFLN
ncbi:hypothetical protein [Methylobrevis albus]|uniref:Uncharacterized protein n=1 Tax=Methylobrevis albus TaxID=2793297 RepID=A0A931I0H8_9HYPH|nr:hypothetical protein [Methylobrevis albus]MBH0237001.1 hypothetical protein [Methylobrevis albus]